MGPMAGPVVAAAVVFEPGTRIEGVNDSKQLNEDERVALDRAIRTKARSIGIGVVDPPEIDRWNVYHAGLEAMRRSVVDLPTEPGHVLVDARTIPGISAPQSGIVRGDSASFTIAAASIVAKVHRDGIMDDLDNRYPEYGFARHKGYCTVEHQEAVSRLGPSPVHRHSYNFIRELVGGYNREFYRLRDLAERVRTASDIRELEEGVREAASVLSSAEKHKLRLLIRRRRSRMERGSPGGRS
jgi:ribonuclease HII